MALIFEKDSRILFIGDSIGDYGRERPRGEGPAGWGTSYIANIGEMLYSTYPESRFQICNMCTGGEQSRHLAARWKTDVLDWHPDWVVLMIGINDVWRKYDKPYSPQEAHPLEAYEACMEQMVQSTLPHVRGMILMTPYFMVQDKNDPMRRDMSAYGQVVKCLAEKYGCRFIDTQAVWDTYFEKSGLHPHALCWDCIHPNRIGAAVLARAFLNAVGYEW